MDVAGRKEIYLEEYSLGSDIHCLVRTYCNVYHTMVMADEYRCTLVFYHVQLVHICQHIGCRYCLITAVRCVPEKHRIPRIH